MWWCGIWIGGRSHLFWDLLPGFTKSTKFSFTCILHAIAPETPHTMHYTFKMPQKFCVFGHVYKILTSYNASGITFCVGIKTVPIMFKDFCILLQPFVMFKQVLPLSSYCTFNLKHSITFIFFILALACPTFCNKVHKKCMLIFHWPCWQQMCWWWLGDMWLGGSARGYDTNPYLTTDVQWHSKPHLQGHHTKCGLTHVTRGGARGGLGGAIAPPGLAIAPPWK